MRMLIEAYAGLVVTTMALGAFVSGHFPGSADDLRTQATPVVASPTPWPSYPYKNNKARYRDQCDRADKWAMTWDEVQFCTDKEAWHGKPSAELNLDQPSPQRSYVPPIPDPREAAQEAQRQFAELEQQRQIDRLQQQLEEQQRRQQFCPDLPAGSPVPC